MLITFKIPLQEVSSVMLTKWALWADSQVVEVKTSTEGWFHHLAVTAEVKNLSELERLQNKYPTSWWEVTDVEGLLKFLHRHPYIGWHGDSCQVIGDDGWYEHFISKFIFSAPYAEGPKPDGSRIYQVFTVPTEMWELYDSASRLSRFTEERPTPGARRRRGARLG